MIFEAGIRIPSKITKNKTNIIKKKNQYKFGDSNDTVSGTYDQEDEYFKNYSQGYIIDRQGVKHDVVDASYNSDSGAIAGGTMNWVLFISNVGPIKRLKVSGYQGIMSKPSTNTALYIISHIEDGYYLEDYLAIHQKDIAKDDRDKISDIIDNGNVNAKSYKDGKELIFKIEFNEDVTVTNENNVKLTFDSVEMEHVKTVKSGSKTLLSTYKVKSGDAALSIKGISANGSEVEDYAENPGNYNYDEISFSNVKIDTTSPVAPVISGFTDGAVLIDDNASVSVTITGEQGAAISYSIDNGATWNVYNSAIKLTNNGEYKIKAKQTDIAGNESLVSDVKTVTIDKGALIKKISATTFNGTYKADDVINGYIEFRGSVTLSDNFAITLNVKNNEIAKKITEFTKGENNKYNFVYKIEEGDTLESEYLNVTGISGTVTYLGQNKTISNPPASNLANNREIKILTGQPKVKDSPSITGEDENAKLNITFDRIVSKGSGNIELAISEDDFLIPTVLTESEYNDISVKINELGTDYKPGLNGATKNNDNTLTPDTTKKYILDFAKDSNDSTLKGKFINAGLNKVVIPMYSSAVSVTESSIIVDLTGEYKLPVKGAEYSITIPAGAVKDSVGNTNVVYASEGKLLAPGVEKPEIRIQKNGYTIKNSSADYSAALQATVKFSCRTPNASVEWVIKKSCQNGDKEKKVNDCNYHDTKTDDVKIEWDENDKKTDSSTTLGDTETEFNKVFGYKYAIMARPKVGSTLSEKEIAYEYAVRTVLKFEIGTFIEGDFDNPGGRKIWIHGGDSTSGDNGIDTFPLSWGKPENFKLMYRVDGNDSSIKNSNWYWVTWDLSAPAYHGFLLGNVPSYASTKGPSEWYVGERTYVPLKSYYVLHPGETLRMQLITGHDDAGRANYAFITKNKGTR